VAGAVVGTAVRPGLAGALTATAVGVTPSSGSSTTWRSGETSTATAASTSSTAANPIIRPADGPDRRSGVAAVAGPAATVCGKTALVPVAARVGSRGCSRTDGGACGAAGSARTPGGVSVAAVTGRVTRPERGSGVWPLPGVGRSIPGRVMSESAVASVSNRGGSAAVRASTNAWAEGNRSSGTLASCRSSAASAGPVRSAR
jgi:hypothetical protein